VRFAAVLHLDMDEPPAAAAELSSPSSGFVDSSADPLAPEAWYQEHVAAGAVARRAARRAARAAAVDAASAPAVGIALPSPTVHAVAHAVVVGICRSSPSLLAGISGSVGSPSEPQPSLCRRFCCGGRRGTWINPRAQRPLFSCLGITCLCFWWYNSSGDAIGDMFCTTFAEPRMAAILRCHRNPRCLYSAAAHYLLPAGSRQCEPSSISVRASYRSSNCGAPPRLRLGRGGRRRPATGPRRMRAPQLQVLSPAARSCCPRPWAAGGRTCRCCPRPCLHGLRLARC